MCRDPKGIAILEKLKLGAQTESEGYLPHKKMARMLSIHHDSVKSILHEGLNLSNVTFKWVHTLDSSQEPAGVQFS
jgi:hypothetical protein